MSRNARTVFKDAVKDHGPSGRHYGLRGILLNLADWQKPNGLLWVKDKLLAGQCGLSVSALREHLKQLEVAGWFIRDRKPGGCYHYQLRDPGSDATIPTVAEAKRLHRNSAGPPPPEQCRTPPPDMGSDSTGTVADTPPQQCRTIRKETYKDVPPNGRPLAQGAPGRRPQDDEPQPPAPGCVRCTCGADHVAGSPCGHCAREANVNGKRQQLANRGKAETPSETNQPPEPIPGFREAAAAAAEAVGGPDNSTWLQWIHDGGEEHLRLAIGLRVIRDAGMTGYPIGKAIPSPSVFDKNSGLRGQADGAYHRKLDRGELAANMSRVGDL